MYLITVVLLLFASFSAQAAELRGTVADRETGTALPGATIQLEGVNRGAIADEQGRFVLSNLMEGTYTLRVSVVGYSVFTDTLTLAALDTATMVVALEAEALEEEEVVVTATRTARNIADVPVRIEAIPQEEVEEKLLMTPSSAAMLLNESTGMRVQTTSSGSGAQNLRIQGLSGRYTQLLLDGIPNFSGLGAGFSLTQLTPLNLRQVEVVKGSNSALYGADAIAGVVNFITKEPRETPELTVLMNGTSQRGLDGALYYGQSKGRNGWTLMASANRQPRVDVDGDGFADVPGYEKGTITPKWTYQPTDSLRLMVTGSFFHEDRLGGSVDAPRSAIGAGTPYLESIRSTRVDGALRIDWKLPAGQTLAAKAAGLWLRRDAEYGSVPFDARQSVLYAEGQYTKDWGRQTLLIGAAWFQDKLIDLTPGIGTSRNYRFRTPGLFVQDEWRFASSWRLLTSARIDRHNRYGTFFTPRASLLYRPTDAVTLRLGGGTGFKAPTLFVEENEERGFRNTRPLTNVVAEKARSFSWDVNWKTHVSDLYLTLNTALYLTWLDHSLIADPDSLGNDVLFLRNATGRLLTRGAEWSVKGTLYDFNGSLGYTYTYVTRTDRGSTTELPLNPRHAFGGVVMWEKEELGGKVGVEAYWTGPQRLEDHPTRTSAPSYWITGVLVEKAWGHARFFVNFENILDTRQTRYEPIIIGSPLTGPVQQLPVYAPLEGRAINGGLRLVW